MAQTNFNEKVDRLLFSEMESNHHPFWGDWVDKENEITEFDELGELLGNESKELFKEEHLSHYDDGRKMPPDVKELQGILKNWLDNYKDWLDKGNFNPNNFVEHDYIFIWVSEWLEMIEDYYPTKNFGDDPNDNKETSPEVKEPEPQQKEPEMHKQLGRKRKPFKDYITLSDKNQLYQRLQVQMAGVSPDVVMNILINNIKNGHILKPSYGAFCDAFPDVQITEATYYYRLRKAGLGQ